MLLTLQRIILLRHGTYTACTFFMYICIELHLIHHGFYLISGQSLGNVEESAYVSTADWRIPLTDLGKKQAQGKIIAFPL